MPARESELSRVLETNKHSQVAIDEGVLAFMASIGPSSEELEIAMNAARVKLRGKLFHRETITTLIGEETPNEQGVGCDRIEVQPTRLSTQESGTSSQQRDAFLTTWAFVQPVVAAWTRAGRERDEGRTRAGQDRLPRAGHRAQGGARPPSPRTQ